MGNPTSIQGDDGAPGVDDPRHVDESNKPKEKEGDSDRMAAGGASVISDPNEAALIDYKTLTWWYVCFPRSPKTWSPC